MRYIGQEYTIDARVRKTVDIETIIASFHKAHHRRYGHSSPSAPVEFLNVRVAALGELKKYARPVELPAGEERSAFAGNREAVFDARPHDTSVLLRHRLPTLFQAEGPAIVEERSATTVVPPGWRVAVELQGNLLLQRI